MSRTPDARARDIETRKIQESITNVEKYFGEMCQLFAGYGRKAARLRDKGDLLVRLIGQYADTETPNLKRGMKQFTDNLAKVQDYRHAEVERLEAKVIDPLKCYGAVVRRQREDLKLTQNARDRESKQMAQLEKARQRNPSDRQIIAESELERATMDATRITRHLEETIDDFEKQKIRDIKKIFGEFVHIEMAFHAKALELYTMAYQSIQSVDEEADLEGKYQCLLLFWQVFRTTLHPPEFQSRLDIVRANSQMSLNRTESFMGTSGSTQQHRANLRQMRKEAEDDEEESEDESEEESEDD